MSRQLEAQYYVPVEHVTCLRLEDIPQPSLQFSAACREAQGQAQLHPIVILQADQGIGLEGIELSEWSQSLPAQVSLCIAFTVLAFTSLI